MTATWATPGHDLVTFPHRIEEIPAAGHEIAAHGCHLRRPAAGWTSAPAR
ncbi:hypothetical protein [Nonomuraea sp. NPDC048916]